MVKALQPVNASHNWKLSAVPEMLEIKVSIASEGLLENETQCIMG